MLLQTHFTFFFFLYIKINNLKIYKFVINFNYI